MPQTPPTTLIPDAGIITAANFPGDSPGDPTHGLEATLELISAAEDLGFNTAGVRQRQLEHGSSSALTVLAAAGQRTSRIRLETSVIPLGFEVPFRLAEDVSRSSPTYEPSSSPSWAGLAAERPCLTVPSCATTGLAVIAKQG